MNVLDRYIELSDNIVDDAGNLNYLRTIFAEDAEVHLSKGKVKGIDNIIEFYAQFYGSVAESKHLWVSRQVNDEIFEARWTATGRLVDGSLIASGGIEYARVNTAGLITDLRNYVSEKGAISVGPGDSHDDSVNHFPE